MSRLFASLFGLLLAAPCFAADVQLHLLPNETLKGELVAIDSKNIVLKTDQGEVTRPLMNVLQLELQAPPANLAGSFTQIGLTDGTVLNCKPDGFVFKDKKVELSLLGDQKVEVPLGALAYVLKDAHDPKIRHHADWMSISKGKRSHDMLVKWFQGRLNGLAGSFPDGKDRSLNFILDGRDTAVPIDLTNKTVQGCIFVNRLDPSSPPQLCKLHDMHGNLLIVAALETKDGASFAVTTVGGAKFDFGRTLVARVDYSATKRVFLSDLEAGVVREPGEDFLDRYRRDRTIDGGKLQINGQKFDKGLFLPAPTKLEYKLDGEYTEFSAVVGVDEVVRGKSHVRLIVEGDGKELFAEEFKRQDKSKPVKLNIKDVQTLRISVEPVEPLAVFGSHLNLADVKISK
ncbi:MAG: NPCBM/NEW2 domain-containing protein [Planctomycetia bacterium]|nr:NPCBM/NEW2 domain-containing protein [Planctomycetia bacterium]